MNDHYHRSEIDALSEEIRNHQWSYTLTFTLPVDSASIGDVWLRMQEGLERLIRRDGTATYSTHVCVNRETQNWDGPHCHGLIRSALTAEQVTRCFNGISTKVAPYRTNHRGDWIGYVLGQAIRDTHLTNMENSYAQIQTNTGGP